MKLRNKLFLTFSLTLAFFVSIAGTMALWSIADDTEFEIQTGQVYFGVGTPTSITEESTGNQTVNYRLTSAQHEELTDNGEIAIPIRVSLLSQGNHGLHYELAAPDFTTNGEGTVFYFAQQEDNIRLFKVSSPAECTVANAPATDPTDKTSTIPATYTDSSTHIEEYWCLTAEFIVTPSYTNTGTATGMLNGDEVSASIDWSVYLNPIDGGGEPIEFTYSTFRPGETP